MTPTARTWLIILAALLVAAAVPLDVPAETVAPLPNADPVYIDGGQEGIVTSVISESSESEIITFDPVVEPDSVTPVTVAAIPPAASDNPAPVTFAVMEPGGLAAFGVGLLGISALRRRR